MQENEAKALIYQLIAADVGGPPLDVAIGSMMAKSGWHAADCMCRFTTSVDAARTLVAEGWPSFQCGTTDDGRGWASFAKHDGAMIAGDEDEDYAECDDAATIPLAVCAAALRARFAIRAATLSKEGE